MIQALTVGAVVGLIFAFAGIFAPAPQNWEGVAGIVGIVAGWKAGIWLMAEIMQSAQAQVAVEWFGRLLP